MTTVRVPLSQAIESRSASLAKDSRTSNCYFESRNGKKEVLLRPGYDELPITGPDTPAGYGGQGLYYWWSSGYMYAFSNNNIYQMNAGGYCKNIGTITGSLGSLNRISVNQTRSVPWMTVQNQENFGLVSAANVYYGSFYAIASASVSAGGSGYAVGNVLTVTGGTGDIATLQVTSVSSGAVTGVTVLNAGSYAILPTNPVSTTTDAVGVGAKFNLTTTAAFVPSGPFVPGIVYLDGYTFIATTEGKIYNSDYENPASWNALDYIIPEAQPDNLVGIARHFNYLVAFKQTTTEFFYDAAYTEGSPLGRNDSARLEIGCVSGQSIVETEQTVLWVGMSKDHGRSVYILDGLSPVRISTAWIENYLNADVNNNYIAYCFKISGHMFYVLTLPSTNKTFVYDLNEKEWYNWSSYYSGAENYFRPQFFTDYQQFYFTIDYINGHIYKITPGSSNDAGNPIYQRIVTGRLDSGTRHRKFINSLQIIGDKTTSTFQVRHSDDDYNTFSNWRSISMNAEQPRILMCGSTRSRSWELLSTDGQAGRLESLEMDVDVGYLEGGPERSALR